MTAAKVSQGSQNIATGASGIGQFKIDDAGVDHTGDYPVNTVVYNSTDLTWHRITASAYINPTTTVDVTPDATTEFDGMTMEAFKGQVQLLTEDAFAVCLWFKPRITSSGWERYISNEVSSNQELTFYRNNDIGKYTFLITGTAALGLYHTGHTDDIRHSFTVVADNNVGGGVGDGWSWIDKTNQQQDPDYSGLHGGNPDLIRLGAKAHDGSGGAADTFGSFCLLDLSSAGVVDTTMREGIRDAWHDANMSFETFATALIALLAGGETIDLTYWKLIEVKPPAISTHSNIISCFSRTITSANSGVESLDATDGSTVDCRGVWLA